MTKCSWCGMDSDNDQTCSWCKRPMPVATVPNPPIAEPADIVASQLSDLPSPEPANVPPAEPKIDWSRHQSRPAPWGWITGLAASVIIVGFLAYNLGANGQKPVVKEIPLVIGHSQPALRLANISPSDSPYVANSVQGDSLDQPTGESSAQSSPQEASSQSDLLSPSPWLTQRVTNPTNSSPATPPTEFDVQADQQTEFEKSITARKAAAIREDVKAYNDALADFETFPAQYQEVADLELQRSMGRATAGSKYARKGTIAMDRTLHEKADALNLLFDKVMGTQMGRELYIRGPLAIARNSRTRREPSTAFEEAARIVESFPYLVER